MGTPYLPYLIVFNITPKISFYVFVMIKRVVSVGVCLNYCAEYEIRILFRQPGNLWTLDCLKPSLDHL
jgi:hypothetical protein